MNVYVDVLLYLFDFEDEMWDLIVNVLVLPLYLTVPSMLLEESAHLDKNVQNPVQFKSVKQFMDPGNHYHYTGCLKYVDLF